MPRRQQTAHRERAGSGPPKQDAPQSRPSWTFTVWLDFQERRRDAVGELARVVRKDFQWPGWRNIEGLATYCRAQQVAPPVLAALRQAWGEWEAARRASAGARGRKN